MISSAKLKSVDFYRKIPRDLTEASLSGAGLSILAALAMMLLFGMELSNYLSVSASTSIVVDKSSDGEFLRIDFNLSFPALSCEFASVDVNDVLGTNRLNITKTVRKYSIDPNLNPTGAEFHPGPIPIVSNHGDEGEGEFGEGSVLLTGASFDKFSHQFPVLVVNFYAPWCPWCNRLAPSWEKASKIIRERYDPELDGRILLGKVDCTREIDLCRRHHIQGYPSIRIFRKGSDVRDDHGHHEHESYYGERDTDTLVSAMQALVAPVPMETLNVVQENNNSSGQTTETAKRPAPLTSGCRIEGFVRVKKVPGTLVITAHSGAHSFDASQINVSHVVSHLSFGKKLNERILRDIKRLTPHLGESVDRLRGSAHVTNHADANANVTVDLLAGRVLGGTALSWDGSLSYAAPKGLIEHYLQVVKTEVLSRTFPAQKFFEYEYTAHSSLVQSIDIPAAKFHFQLSPMQVLVEENPKSFSHFITNVCAIIGGVFTVAGILESILQNTISLMKKVELGKQF